MVKIRVRDGHADNCISLEDAKGDLVSPAVRFAQHRLPASDHRLPAAASWPLEAGTVLRVEQPLAALLPACPISSRS